MTHDDALAALADHPHAWRYRQLVEDDTDPERRDAYRGLVIRLAKGDPLPVATPAVPVSCGDPPPAARPCGACP